jgi:hypothetical protein
MRAYKKLRSDTYEAQLTEEEREQLYVWLAPDDVSLAAVSQKAPVWRTGRFAGRRPSPLTLRGIAAMMRTETAMAELQITDQVARELSEKLEQMYGRGKMLDKMLDRIMALIGNEVMKRTLKGLDPRARAEAAKLLLRRSDQKLNREKFQWTKKVFREEAKALRQKSEAEAKGGSRAGAITRETWDRIEKELKLL